MVHAQGSIAFSNNEQAIVTSAAKFLYAWKVTWRLYMMKSWHGNTIRITVLLRGKFLSYHLIRLKMEH